MHSIFLIINVKIREIRECKNKKLKKKTKHFTTKEIKYSKETEKQKGC